MVDSFFDALPEHIELIMGYGSALFIIAVPIAVFVAYRKTQNETNKAKEAAGRLGLNYINVAEEMKNSKPKDSFLLGLLSGWSTWAMEGKYNNVPVRVELIVKGKQQRYIAQSDRVSVSNPTRTSYSRGTVYIASFQKPLPFDVGIRQNVPTPSLVGALRSGIQQTHAADTIGTGDEELDQMLSVSGSDKDRIQEWLSSDQRKDALKKIYQALPSINVNNDGLRLHDQHSKVDYYHLQNNLKLLSEAILKLQID
ncbi:hypothetical protein ACFLZL_03105 [Thermodesulfobacteriota bacterium]